jgi:hypothetical protein
MLKKLARCLLVSVAALAAVPGLAAAAGEVPFGSSKQYDVCGGSYAGYTGFGLCASVNVSVFSQNGSYYLRFQVYNTSGTSGSYNGSVFTRIGLDNVIYNGININAKTGTLVVRGPCAANPQLQCDYTNDWVVQNDKTNAGGINVDLVNATVTGVNSSVVSSCISPSQVPASGNVITTSCNRTAPLFAEFTFQLNALFDPSAAGGLYIKAQNGYAGASTYCSSADPTNCMTVVVPEPVTLTLLGTGMAAMGLGRVVRRRRKVNAGPTVES